MKKIRLSTEYIVAILISFVIIIVLIFAFSNISPEGTKQDEYLSQMRKQIRDTTAYFNDSIADLEREIKDLRKIIISDRQSNNRDEDIEKLKSFVDLTSKLVAENKLVLENIPVEPPKNKLAMDYLTDLIKALIDNINLREERITYLTEEIKALENRIKGQQIQIDSTESKLEEVKQEKEEVEKIAEEQKQELENLRKFYFIVGTRKQLRKESILVKKLFHNELYLSNKLSIDQFQKVSLKEGQQSIELGEVKGEKVFCTPMLTGAAIIVESNKLILQINDIDQLIANGKVVFYY